MRLKFIEKEDQIEQERVRTKISLESCCFDLKTTLNDEKHDKYNQ